MGWPVSPDAIVLTALVAGGAVSAAIDVRTRRVPNWLTGGIAALGLALAALDASGLSVAAAFGGGALGLLLMLPGYVIARTGAGDVKLLAALGTLLGPKLALAAFIYTALAGGLLAIAVAVRRRRLRASLGSAAQFVRTGGANVDAIEDSAHNRFAYAPAIALGAIVAAMGA